MSASGTSAWANPVPTPRPASCASTRRPTNASCSAGSVSCSPVVRRISPPESQGVGSVSSEMCTQRTGTSRFASPLSSRTSRSRISSRTESTGRLQELHLPRGLLEHRPQHALDLREVLLGGDERRGELDDRVAAVVGAADQAAAEQLAREEPAEQDLGLLGAEALLGLA